MFTSGAYFFATRIPSSPYFQGLAWWEMTMCVFLCVLFKTDGRFTLAEMAINSLEREKEGGGATQRQGHCHAFHRRGRHDACCGHT